MRICGTMRDGLVERDRVGHRRPHPERALVELGHELGAEADSHNGIVRRSSTTDAATVGRGRCETPVRIRAVVADESTRTPGCAVRARLTARTQRAQDRDHRQRDEQGAPMSAKIVVSAIGLNRRPDGPERT